MKATKEINIYLTKKRNVRQTDVVQYDTGIQLVFTVMDLDIPSGATATLYVQKPSGKFVYQEDGITVADNTITIDLDNQAITEHGKVPYQVSLASGSDVITTFTGLMMVEKSLKDAGATESKTVVRAFDEAVADHVAEFQTKAEQIVQACIATLPDDYTAMEAKVNELANAIKGNLSGAVVFADDVSPVEHIPSVKVHGRNLCSMDAFNSMASNGASNTYDGSTHTITMGADTALSNFTGRYCRPLGYNFKVGVEYTISFEVRGTPGKKVACGWDTGRIDITLTDDFVRYGTTKRATRTDEVVSFYSTSTEKGGLAAGEYMQFTNVQIEVGNVMTDYVEYIDTSTTTVTRCGKNQLKGRESNLTVSGVTFTVNGNGTITANGTCTGLILLPAGSLMLKAGKTYTLSGCPSGGSSDTYRLDIRDLDGEMYGSPNVLDYGSGATFTATDDRKVDCVLRVASGATISRIFYPMVRFADTDSLYEQYNGAEYIPASDGTVAGITSLSPNTTILTDTEGVIVECEYNRDTNKVINKIITALGGTI